MIGSVALGEVLEIARNGLSVKQFEGAGGLPITRIETISNGEINPAKVGYAELSEDRYQDWLLQKGDILISHINSMQHLGKCAIYEGKPTSLIHGMNLLGVRPRQNMVLPRYMMHFFKSHYFFRQIPRIANQSVNQSSFSVTKFKTLKIPLPPLSEQKRIAAILDKADAIRKKRKQTIELTETFLRSAFLEMFGDPVTNPKGWEVKPLSMLADVVSGVTKGRNIKGKDTLLVPYMRVANVQDGFICLNDIAKIEATAEEVEKYKLNKGDLLLTEGGDPDKLGRGSVWNGDIDLCIHQNHIFRVRCNVDLILPEYLSSLIGSARGKQYFLRAAKQTTGIASINMTQLKGFPSLIPPLDLQRKYLKVVNKRTSTLKRMDTTTLNHLQESLFQRAFRGKL